MTIYGIAARGLASLAPGSAIAGVGIAALQAADLLQQIGNVVDALGRLAGQADTVADEMVALMRERGPDDSFALEEGTTWRRDGEAIEVTASSQRDGVDYGPFVEFGTVNMEAEPFFWSSAREVLDRWRDRIAVDIDNLPAETGLT